MFTIPIGAFTIPIPACSRSPIQLFTIPIKVFTIVRNTHFESKHVVVPGIEVLANRWVDGGFLLLSEKVAAGGEAFLVIDSYQRRLLDLPRIWTRKRRSRGTLRSWGRRSAAGALLQAVREGSEQLPGRTDQVGMLIQERLIATTALVHDLAVVTRIARTSGARPRHPHPQSVRL